MVHNTFKGWAEPRMGLRQMPMTKTFECRNSCQVHAAISALYRNATQPSEPRLDTEPVVGIGAKAWEGISGAKY